MKTRWITEMTIVFNMRIGELGCRSMRKRDNMVLMGNTTTIYMIDMLKEGKITSKNLLTIISLLFYRIETAIIGTNSKNTIETGSTEEAMSNSANKKRIQDSCKNRQINFCCRQGDKTSRFC